jgi:hypothetical protein
MPKCSVLNNEEEELKSPTNSEEGMMETNDKEETTPIDRECTRNEMMDTSQEEPTMPNVTQRSKVCSNDMNTTPLDIDFVQYIHNLTTPLKFAKNETKKPNK